MTVWSHGCLWLARVSVIDREIKEITTESKSEYLSISCGERKFWHLYGLNLSDIIFTSHPAVYYFIKKINSGGKLASGDIHRGSYSVDHSTSLLNIICQCALMSVLNPLQPMISNYVTFPESFTLSLTRFSRLFSFVMHLTLPLVSLLLKRYDNSFFPPDNRVLPSSSVGFH